MNPVDTLSSLIPQVLNYLCQTYQPQLIFLYGSFADNSQTTTSDIDILCFAERAEFVHDSTDMNGHLLDAWIYPLAKMDEIAEFKHIWPCKVLFDTNGVAEKLMAGLREARANVSGMTVAEREQHLRWLEKMLKRAYANTAEGNYRYHWLLFEFPESYCRLRGEYFDGPVKTLRRMEHYHPELFLRYETLLSGEKSVALLAQIYHEIKNHN